MATAASGSLNFFMSGPTVYSASGHIPLYMPTVASGHNYSFGQTDLFIQGALPSGSLNLYIGGASTLFSTYDTLNLFIGGAVDHASNNIDLYISGEANDQLYYFGLSDADYEDMSSSEYYSLLIGGNGEDGVAVPTTGSMNLYMPVIDGISNSIDLYLKVNNAPTTSSGYINFYSFGVTGIASSGINLHTFGIGLANNHIPLFVRGYNAGPRGNGTISVFDEDNTILNSNDTIPFNESSSDEFTSHGNFDVGTSGGNTYRVFESGGSNLESFTVDLEFIPDDEGQSDITWALYTAPDGVLTDQLDSGSLNIRSTQTVSGLTQPLTVGEEYAIVLNQLDSSDTNYYNWINLHLIVVYGGLITEDSLAEKIVTIRNTGTGILTISSVGVVGNISTTVNYSNIQLSPGGELPITVVLDTSTPGSKTGHIVINSDSGGSASVFNVYFSGEVT